VVGGEVVQEKWLSLMVMACCTVRLNKPVYRFLANQKWREYRRPILIQRLTQMHVVPDVLPVLDPVVDVQLRFRGYDVQPGTILDSLQTQVPPTFKVIPFTTGQMLCTVLVVDSGTWNPRLLRDDGDCEHSPNPT